jgi:LmbE family N-acetylglucosaminyl deacetylase
MQSRRQQMFDAGIISEEEFNRFNPIGSEHDDIDVEVDGRKYVEHKINSMKAHRSQFKEDWWGFNIPDEFKEEFLGYENYILAFNRGQWFSEKELI